MLPRNPSCEVADAFLRRAQALLLVRLRPFDKTYVRGGGGCKPKEARRVFESVIYVLRTGCQWKALPAKRFGSAIRARFLQGEHAGFLKVFYVMSARM